MVGWGFLPGEDDGNLRGAETDGDLVPIPPAPQAMKIVLLDRPLGSCDQRRLKLPVSGAVHAQRLLSHIELGPHGTVLIRSPQLRLKRLVGGENFTCWMTIGVATAGRDHGDIRLHDVQPSTIQRTQRPMMGNFEQIDVAKMAGLRHARQAFPLDISCE